MGGLVSEQIIHDEINTGRSNFITAECGKDLEKATNMARRAVREFGMFGEDGSGFLSSSKDDSSQKFNAMIDEKVKEILDASYNRVTELLSRHKHEIIMVAKNLFWYDYLDENEIELLMKGKKITKEHLREWEESDSYLIEF